MGAGDEGTGLRVTVVCDGITVMAGPLRGDQVCGLGLVDELLRRSLAARHMGCSVLLSGVDEPLLELLRLTGVEAVFVEP